MPRPTSAEQVKIESDGTPWGTFVYVNGEKLKWPASLDLHIDHERATVLIRLHDGAAIAFDGPMNRRENP